MNNYDCGPERYEYEIVEYYLSFNHLIKFYYFPPEDFSLPFFSIIFPPSASTYLLCVMVSKGYILTSFYSMG